MKKEEILKLWEKVKEGDKSSTETFIGLYLSRFPYNAWIIDKITKDKLHIMYSHLTNN